MQRTRSIIELGSWIVGLGCSIAFLYAAGRGTLALPSFTTEAWSSWVQKSDMATVVFAIARAAALVASCYLLLSTLALCLACAVRSERLTRLASAAAIPTVRALAKRAVVLSFVGALATPVAASAATTSPDVPVLHHLTPAEVHAKKPTTTTTVPDVLTSGPLTPSEPIVAAAPTPTAADAKLNKSWTVKSGDNLWRISEVTLHEALGREPTDAEVVAYWRDMVNVNRPQLVDVRNPNLIRPGQIMILPPVARK